MSIRCYTGARLHEMAPGFVPPPAPPAKRLAGALLDRREAQRRCSACTGWTSNRGRICTRCLLAGRGRA